MNRLKLLPLILAAVSLSALTHADDTAPQHGIRDNTPDVHAFTGATVIVAPGNALANATLVVRDGRVEAVGGGIAAPADAVIHDLSGLTVYPGFVDPYTQYGVEPAAEARERGRPAPVYDGTRVGGNAWNDAIHAEMRWSTEFAPDSKTAKSLLELGYSVVQSSRMDGIFRGQGFVASLRDATPNETILAPVSRQFLSFSKGSSKQAYPSSLMGSIALVRQTLHDAAWYAKASAAGKAELNTALAALAAWEGPFIIETRDELTLLRASRVASELGRPMVYLGTHREGNRIDEIAALKSPIILPVSLPRRPDVVRPGDELEVTLGQLRLWERAPQTAALLESRGVPLAFTAWRLGSEEDFFVNIRDMIEAGLSPDTALAALTTMPAKIAGVDREVGTLEKGKRANFVIASGDLFASGAAEAPGLLEVWIDGERAYRSEPDFRGTYEAALHGHDVRIEISGVTKSKVKATLSVGEQSTPKADVVLAERVALFSADLAPIGIEGKGWFRLESPEAGVLMTYTSPSGAVASSTLKVAPKKDVRAEETTAKVDDAPVSHSTMPNVAFGWETLPRAEAVLVRNATIWTSDTAGVLEGADMLVTNGRIAKISKGLEPPKGARVIDATGMHVTPGIIDEHSHLAISAGVNEGTHASTAEVRIGDVINPDDIGIYRALAGGVTAAQLLHGSANPIGGQAQIIRFKWGASSEELKFPNAPPSIKFALGENVKQSNWGEEYTTRYPQTRMGVESFLRDRFLAAREYSADWKSWNALAKDKRAKAPPPRRDLELETLVEILESKRFIHCHSYVQSEILMLMRLAEELGFRISTFTHILEGYKLASEMREHGAGAAGFSDWWAYKAEVWDAIPYSPCLTHDKGVVTAINSDSANTIRRLNQEAGKIVMYCGMDQVEALKMVTINPARLLAIDDRVGSLREGKDADFVIWNGNPLSMTSRALQTWIEGTNYFDVERDAAMRERDAAEKAALLEKVSRATDKRGGAPPEAAQFETWHCDDLGGLTDAR